MKKLLILLFLWSNSLNAQFDYFWLDIDDQNLWDLGEEAVETDSHYFFTVATFSPWAPSIAQILRVDKENLHTDFFPLNYYYAGTLQQMEMTPSGTIILAGSFYDGAIETDNGQLFMLEIDPETMDTLRSITFGKPGWNDNISRLILTQDGGVAITGWSFDADPSTKQSIFLFKADSLWNQEYFNLYAQVPNRNHFGNSLIQTPDGGFFIVGNRQMDQDYFMDQAILLKVDSGGNFQFWKNILPVGNEYGLIAVGVKKKINGNYLAVGNKIVTTTGVAQDMQYWAFEFDSDGEVIWSDTYGGLPQGAQWESINLAPDGNYLVCGYLRENSHYVNDTLFKRQYGAIGKLSPEGELLWHRLYTNEPLNKHVDIFWNAIPTSDGGILCVGTTWGDSLTHQDVWAVKLDEWGCIEPGCEGPTEVVEVDIAPVEVAVYPDPARDKFTLKLPAPLEKNAELRLYNMMGQVVKTYSIPSGFEEYPFLLPAVQCGLYFYSLSVDEEIIASGKLIKE
ncbi:MAG: T9SS type A sorting domain-containing protein [Lewinellaceae bacterium]|nr:T9SS type A sorting domain-containing protein [Lewinellaceae bacterium]